MLAISKAKYIAERKKNMEEKKEMSSKCIALIMVIVCTCSILVNIVFVVRVYYLVEEDGLSELSWSRKAAAEAESVAAISCSGHGRAYLDGIILDGKEPICECNPCYGGPHCSQFYSACAADADRYIYMLFLHHVFFLFFLIVSNGIVYQFIFWTSA